MRKNDLYIYFLSIPSFTGILKQKGREKNFNTVIAARNISETMLGKEEY